MTHIFRHWFLRLILIAFTSTNIYADENCSDPVVEKPRPPVELPWQTYAQLCQADFGLPWTQGIPPTGSSWPEQANLYGEKVKDFLNNLTYRKPQSQNGLAWLHDARWRVTGDWAGCPTATQSDEKWTNEVHPAVKIYYSPEVVSWLCQYRVPGKEISNPPPLPKGAMIVKEMHQATKLAYRPDSAAKDVLGKLWVDDQGQYDDPANGLQWTIMIKGDQSYDGWYWGYFAYNAPNSGVTTYNPPILSRSAFATAVDPKTGFPLKLDLEGEPLPASAQVPPPLGPWYPTFWNFSTPDIVYPNASFGNYCIYCHGSAESQSTFSSLKNIMAKELEYNYLAAIPKTPSPTPSTVVNEHNVKNNVTPLLGSSLSSRAPFPEYNPKNLTVFQQTFPQFKGLSYDQVWPHRLPAQTWDHTLSPNEGPEQFMTSDQCMPCHDASGAGQRTPNMVVIEDNNQQINLTEYAEWSVSPMGLAGRDPIFYSMLESELNRAEQETDLQKYAPCIQNTCLHCHGNMGQRQYALDTQTDSDQLCKDFEPITDPSSEGSWSAKERLQAGYGGQPFLLKDMAAWHGEGSSMAKYGGLGRDGISCLTCHHMQDQDLGLSGKTFTGNFRVGKADEIYGPFDDVITDPMKMALGTTPTLGKALNKSSMCGSCHAIYLPIFDNQGKLKPGEPAAFEQTTYLEWLNSAFNEENNNVASSQWRSCQDCHMRNQYVYTDQSNLQRIVSLAQTRIANIQDNTFPEAEYEQENLDLKFRNYKRHTLYGLNIFLNQYFQQFPLLLGIRQQDYMASQPQAPLITGQEEVLKIADQATATVTIDDVVKSSTGVSANVTVTNRSGHKLPSGVGFRRAFVEFKILDENGQPIWASGLTSDVGVIQDGILQKNLASELLQFDTASACTKNYQPHYQVISKPCQVQIYEELAKDSSGVFTTSFIHRYNEVKDNRLLPKGYRVLSDSDPQPDYCRPWCQEANPKGQAASDPDYRSADKAGVKGQDTVRYAITLDPQQLAKAKTITATLYSQATAPYFLNQRFSQAKNSENNIHAKRLYFLQGHLNTDVKSVDGERFIHQYKLKIAGDTQSL